MEGQKTRQHLELTNDTSGLPSQDGLEAISKQSNNETPTTAIEDQNKPNIEGKILSIQEAFALAVERGYKPVDKNRNARDLGDRNALETFRKWFTAKNNQGKSMYSIAKVEKERGKYIDLGRSG